MIFKCSPSCVPRALRSDLVLVAGWVNRLVILKFAFSSSSISRVSCCVYKPGARREVNLFETCRTRILTSTSESYKDWGSNIITRTRTRNLHNNTPHVQTSPTRPRPQGTKNRDYHGDSGCISTTNTNTPYATKYRQHTLFTLIRQY